MFFHCVKRIFLTLISMFFSSKHGLNKFNRLVVYLIVVTSVDFLGQPHTSHCSHFLSFIPSSINSSIHPSIHPSIRSFVRSFVRLFIRSFTWFVHPFMHFHVEMFKDFCCLNTFRLCLTSFQIGISFFFRLCLDVFEDLASSPVVSYLNLS